MTISNDDLHDMSDDELEAAFKSAKAEQESGVEAFDEPEEPTETEEPVEDLDVVEDEDSTEDVEDEDSLQDEESAEESEEVEEEENADTDDEGEEGEKPADTPAVDEAPKKHVFKANGKEYEFTAEEITAQFPKVFGQAMDYTKKLQTIQPWRRTIDALEQASLSHKDVNLMIDVLKGDKDAIAEVIQRTGVDTLEIDPETASYKETNYGRSDSELAVVDVLDSIKDDPEYAVTHKILASEWDEESWASMSSDPIKIKQLHHDVKSGMYAKLQPAAEKLSLYDGGRKTALEYYMDAASNYFAAEERTKNLARQQELQESENARLAATQTQVANATRQQQKREAVKQDASRRKAAAPSGRASARGTVTDYLSASDEDFDEWYNKLSENE